MDEISQQHHHQQQLAQQGVLQGMSIVAALQSLEQDPHQQVRAPQAQIPTQVNVPQGPSHQVQIPVQVQVQIPQDAQQPPQSNQMASLMPSMPPQLMSMPQSMGGITKKRRRTDGDAAGGRAKLTLKDKFDILTYWDQFPEQQNYAAIGRKYDVSRQSIRKVVQNRELILQDYHNGVPHDAKRCRVLPPDMALLDEKVLEYISSLPAPASNMKRNVLPISMEVLKAKATEIATQLGIKINKGRSTEAQWVANNTWYARFCNRHNFIREPLPVETSMMPTHISHPPVPVSVSVPVPTQVMPPTAHLMDPVTVTVSIPTMVEEQKPENTSMMYVGLKDDDSSIDSQE